MLNLYKKNLSIDNERLLSFAHKYQNEYLNNLPFPHIIIDNFLPLNIANHLEKHFPSKDEQSFAMQDNDHQSLKIGRTQDKKFKNIRSDLVHFLNELNGIHFIDFLEQLTKIRGLIPDPHFKGAAFHQTLPKGKLDIHVDFNFDKKRHLYRRINVLLYLNKKWEDNYGGHLELWDHSTKTCHKKVLPLFNRCVIFSTSSNSYHGHPLPLSCPTNRTRKSIATYYYTVEPGPNMSETPHSTIWIN